MTRLATTQEEARLRAAGMLEHDEPGRWWRPMWPDNGDGRPRHISTDDALALIAAERSDERRAVWDLYAAQALGNLAGARQLPTAPIEANTHTCADCAASYADAMLEERDRRFGGADASVALLAAVDALRVARDLLVSDPGKTCQEAVREIDDTLLQPDVRHAVPPHLLKIIEDARGRR